METIKINDIEYIKKEEYDKLKSTPINQMDYSIVESCNVLAIVPFDKDRSIEDETDLIIVKGLATFKAFKEEVKLANLDENFKPEKVILGTSKYGYEFFQIAIKTARAFGFDEKPEFYLKFEKDKYVKDYPCLIKINKMVFILAPRVEND